MPTSSSKHLSCATLQDLYSQAELQYKQGEAAAFGYLKGGPG